jgi:5'-nucleotidase / UDP-sugar diphosphatase
VAAHSAKLDKALNVVVGKTGTAFDSQRLSVRSQETAMGNLTTDAMRDAVGADIGLTSGGGIRGDRAYEAGVELTRKDILAELPFGNVTVLMELSGAQVRAALEHGVSSIEKGAGRFLQVSGVSFSVNRASAIGSRVSDINVGGKALDEAATYAVATNDCIACGGDGFSVLKRGTQMLDTSAATLMASQVIDYLAKRGSDLGLAPMPLAFRVIRPARRDPHTAGVGQNDLPVLLAAAT